MPFSESVKKEVKEKAMYKCCICQRPFIDVHHIVPESKEGSNDIDNAAPLCKGCHGDYGGNPEKRKQIREMRDLWYKICSEQRVFLPVGGYVIQLNNLYEKFEKGLSSLEQIKDVVITRYEDSAAKVREAKNFDEISAATGIIPSDTAYSDDVKYCPHCGVNYMIPPEDFKCAVCGNELSKQPNN